MMIRHTILKLGVALGILGLAGMHTQATAATTDAFVEQTGRLIIETESVSAEADWSVDSNIDGHTGTSYLVWRGSNNYAKSEAGRGAPIRYPFRIVTPGNYELRWRSRNTVDLDATEHNDSWVRFPTGNNIEGQHFLDGWTKAYMGQVAQWTWDAYTVDGNNKPIRQFFSAGEHYLEIAGRSNGHGLDRLALYQYDNEDFVVDVFDALPESPQASELNLDGHTYTGNSCVAGTLSLAADKAARFNGETLALLEGDIVTDGSPQYSLLQFNMSGVQSDTAALTLASLQNSLSLSVYLASDSDWEDKLHTDTPPYPSTLLGQFESTDGANQLFSIDINPRLINSEKNSLILVSEPGMPQAIHGIGTHLEPRLSFTVSEQFCQDYQLGKTGQQESTQEESTEEETSDVVTVDEPAQAENNVDTTTNADTSDTRTPFDAVNANSPENLPATTGNSAKSGGALSLHSLLWLSIIAGFFYTSKYTSKRTRRN